MSDNLEQRIQARIALLKQARDKLIQDANQQLVGYNTAISEMELLLAPPVDADTNQVDALGRAAAEAIK